MDTLSEWQKWGAGGAVLIPFLLYQMWKMWKEDRKGNNIDARIDAYGITLQSTIDKLAKKIDDLSAIKDKLVTDNAIFSAQLIVAKRELEEATEEIKIHVARIKYLESVLKEKGIAYA